MMLPNAEIRLYNNIPFSDYTNQMLFNNLQEQKDWFNSQDYIFSDNNSVTPYSEGILRVDGNSEQYYSVNYISFKNSSYGEKWFYGFVTKVEWLSEKVSLIHYEIDVFNTWFYDLEFKESFIERETVESDLVGEHTIPEGLETGPYTTSQEKNILSSDLSVYMMVTEVKWEYKEEWWDQEKVIDLSPYFQIKPSRIGGFPISCYVAKFGTLNSLNTTALNTILDAYAQYGKSDSVVAIFTAPTEFVSTSSEVRTSFHSLAANFMEGYSPKNSKLMTYPYSTLVLQAGGSTTELRYELFNTVPQLKVIGGFGANLQVLGIPLFYENQKENMMYSMAIKDFPLLPYNRNYYENWLAQNKNSIGLSNTIATAGAIGGVATSLLTGNVFSGIASIGGAAATIANNMMATDKAKITPDTMNGTVNASDLIAIIGKSGFYSYCRHITPQYAKSIDDYFSRFGYKVNVSKVPNLKSRKYWNYIKINDPILVGNIPSSDLREIKRIFNDGITLWHDEFYFGDYSQNNEIIGKE